MSKDEQVEVEEVSGASIVKQGFPPQKGVCIDWLFTIWDMLGVALGMMAAISVEEKGPLHTFSAVVEHLRARGRKKVIFRIDGEPAIRALGVAIQQARSEETAIECRPKYSSPSMGSVENMDKELFGLVRCFRIYLREKAKMEITTESPLLPWLVRHCVWILSRYAVGADGRNGYSRLKGCEYTAGVRAIWYMLPKTADLTKLDDSWRTAIWLGKSDRSDEHIIGLETGAVLTRSIRRKAEGKRWNERALKMVTGTPWNPRPGGGGETTVHHTSFGGEIRSNRRLRGMLPEEPATFRARPGTI